MGHKPEILSAEAKAMCEHPPLRVVVDMDAYNAVMEKIESVRIIRGLGTISKNITGVEKRGSHRMIQ